MSHGDRQTQRRAIVIIAVVGDEVVNAAARRVPSLTRRCRAAAVEQVNCRRDNSALYAPAAPHQSVTQQQQQQQLVHSTRRDG